MFVLYMLMKHLKEVESYTKWHHMCNNNVFRNCLFILGTLNLEGDQTKLCLICEHLSSLLDDWSFQSRIWLKFWKDTEQIYGVKQLVCFPKNWFLFSFFYKDMQACSDTVALLWVCLDLSKHGASVRTYLYSWRNLCWHPAQTLIKCCINGINQCFVLRLAQFSLWLTSGLQILTKWF